LTRGLYLSKLLDAFGGGRRTPGRKTIRWKKETDKMRITLILLAVVAAASSPLLQTISTVGPTEKLGQLVGRWESEVTSTGAVKAEGTTKTLRECRWAPQGHDFLVCEVTRSSPEGRQLAIYSYNDKENKYVVTIIVKPGAAPQLPASLSIQGNVWTSITPAGEGRQMRTTINRSPSGPNSLQVEASEDGGAHWTLAARGTERKIGD
jgi:hypothetical protein